MSSSLKSDEILMLYTVLPYISSFQIEDFETNITRLSFQIEDKYLRHL